MSGERTATEIVWVDEATGRLVGIPDFSPGREGAECLLFLPKWHKESREKSITVRNLLGKGRKT